MTPLLMTMCACALSTLRFTTLTLDCSVAIMALDNILIAFFPLVALMTSCTVITSNLLPVSIYATMIGRFFTKFCMDVMPLETIPNS